MSDPSAIEDLLRPLAPQVLAGLVRRYGRFDACEDAVQEALIAATEQWPRDGVPESPRAWLGIVAARRLADNARSETSRRAREELAEARRPADELVAHPPQPEAEPADDDTLALLFMCCHPELSPTSQVALTLRAVGGLTTTEIASAFLVPEPTMGQRISRAKQTIKAAGGRFEPSPDAMRDERLGAVLHVLYLIFNEGYTATAGSHLVRVELTAEAIRLTREVHRLRPADDEVTGLLALMLLTDARRPARTGTCGELIPLAEQDRGLWDADRIAEGTALVAAVLAAGPVGPYQLQAAIAAVHADARRAQDTDWSQIAALYLLLERESEGPVVRLNRAVAVGMADGPAAGLELLETLAGDGRLAGNHRVDAVRAHLLELAGDTEGARDRYLAAARATASLPEQRYLESRAKRMNHG